MDDFDVKLLRALQDDGRLTNYDLAERVGLSASQCSRRRSALEEEGVIEGYHAALSTQALGLDVIVFVQVTLATHSPDNSKRFATAHRRPRGSAGGLFADRRGRLPGQDRGAGPHGAVAHPQRRVPAARERRAPALVDRPRSPQADDRAFHCGIWSMTRVPRRSRDRSAMRSDPEGCVEGTHAMPGRSAETAPRRAAAR